MAWVFWAADAATMIISCVIKQVLRFFFSLTETVIIHGLRGDLVILRKSFDGQCLVVRTVSFGEL